MPVAFSKPKLPAAQMFGAAPKMSVPRLVIGCLGSCSLITYSRVCEFIKLCVCVFCSFQYIELRFLVPGGALWKMSDRKHESMLVGTALGAGQEVTDI